ncbi:serine hydrolase [Brevibacillus agri]|uniref:serine hydrolase n=1 Tax=Brevibacillus agri TaxID=51101 RepID=UPI002E208F24|nr:class A beta-lactamase-related serine hydrolase [Brevibacillus agri]
MDLEKSLSAILQEAKGAWGVVVKELAVQNGAYFAHRPDELFIAESVIKVPIMAAVYAACEQGKARIDAQLALRKEDLVAGSGFLYALSPGLKLSIRDLVTLMIIQSDNTATNMLIDLVGKEQIDRTMRELGMERSRYSRKLMIYPQDVTENNMITAGDVARMLEQIACGGRFSRWASADMIAIMQKQQVLHGLPSQLPSRSGEDGQAAWELACKSGWDTGRQHDVGILSVQGRQFAIAALSQDVRAEAALHTLGLLGRAVYDFAVA